MALLDVELNGEHVIGLEGTDILYQFASVAGLEHFCYSWRGLRTSKSELWNHVWVNGRENFLALLAFWNDGNRSFRFEENNSEEVGP